MPTLHNTHENIYADIPSSASGKKWLAVRVKGRCLNWLDAADAAFLVLARYSCEGHKERLGRSGGDVIWLLSCSAAFKTKTQLFTVPPAVLQLAPGVLGSSHAFAPLGVRLRNVALELARKQQEKPVVAS